jgi:glycosyltransferase involved in cell wall biosynthesis
MLSIIICTYNRQKYIYNCLKNVAENDFSCDKYEIILVNNNSTDNTETECECFKNDYPQVDFRYFVEINQGLSFARNRGVEEASGDFLVFLDDDAFVEKNYLANLENNLAKYENIDAFGGKITPLFESGITPKWLSKWTYSWVSGIDLGNKTTSFNGNNYPIGANMGISRKAIEKIGGFNIKLGRSKKNLMAGEEKDIFNRLKAQSGAIYYFPNVAVQHVIPENRTTDDFIKRLGNGVGQSERLRTLNISKMSFCKRVFTEFIKWVASIVLFAGYCLKFQPQKGSKLLLFRWNVTLGLFSIKN